MGLDSILLIEDERINAMAFQKGLTRVSSTTKLTIRETAEDGLAYLRGEIKIPDIIVLDLNLPKMHGIDFLKMVKSDDKFKRIPVIVLTTSSNQQDKIDCFNAQVAGYFIKPLDYFDLIKSIFEYWTNSEFAYPAKLSV